MNDFETFETHFAAPLAEVRSRVIERIAKFDQHVQRHEQPLDIFAPCVIDERLDGHERAARWQGVVGCVDEVFVDLFTDGGLGFSRRCYSGR